MDESNTPSMINPLPNDKILHWSQLIALECRTFWPRTFWPGRFGQDVLATDVLATYSEKMDVLAKIILYVLFM